MASKGFICFIFLVCITFSNATPHPKRQSAGYLHFPLKVRKAAAGTKLAAGNSTTTIVTPVPSTTTTPPGSGGFSLTTHTPTFLPVPLQQADDNTEYVVELEIGSNPSQKIELQLDTGSSDIWVYGAGSCKVCEGGTFDPSGATRVPSLDPFSISYTDGTSASGYFIKENLVFSGTTVSSATIAVATKSANNGPAVMGIGLDAEERGATQYPGFIDDLYNQGLIGKRAYSVFLDDPASATGSLILGGYDTSKYSGTLKYLPVIAAEDGGSRLAVTWYSIAITDSTGSLTYTSKKLPLPRSATLDTGSTYLYLPSDMFDIIRKKFNGTLDSNGNVLLKDNKDCNIGTGSFDFQFGSKGEVMIHVPFSQLVSVRGTYCILGIAEAGSNAIFLGDTFLRAAYVVYDYDAKMIGLAQANYNNTCSNCVVPF